MAAHPRNYPGQEPALKGKHKVLYHRKAKTFQSVKCDKEPAPSGCDLWDHRLELSVSPLPSEQGRGKRELFLSEVG